jgi:hypothetical protein
MTIHVRQRGTEWLAVCRARPRVERELVDSADLANCEFCLQALERGAADAELMHVRRPYSDVQSVCGAPVAISPDGLRLVDRPELGATCATCVRVWSVLREQATRELLARRRKRT